jgi:hypothetical protein
MIAKSVLFLLMGSGPLLFPQASSSALFAHVAVGGGYTTVFTFLNTGSTPLTGNLILTKSDGTPLTAALSDPTGAVGSSVPLSIAPGGTQFVTASSVNASDTTATGWARVESTGGTLGGVATFQLVEGGTLKTIAGVLASGTVDTATIPLDDDDAAARYTGYAIANPGAEAITIKAVTVKADGTPGATLRMIALRPGEQVAAFFFQAQEPSNRVFQGSVVLMGQGGAKFVLVALVQDQGLFTAIPVINAKAPGIN